MSDAPSPKALAITWSKAWGKRFPVIVREVAFEASRRQPDRISKIQDLPIELDNFEGALLRKSGGKNWGIAYSSYIREEGKVNFTVAHELGHYLLHRDRGVVLCTEDDLRDFARPDHSAANVEQQANEFASYLLMPMDDFRAQIPTGGLNMGLIVHCANRYGTSLAASALKLIEFIDRAVICISAKDGAVRWSRSSKRALEAGLFLRRGTPIPAGTLTHQSMCGLASGDIEGSSVGSNLWKAFFHVEELRVLESVVVQPHYGSVFSLLDCAGVTRKWRWDDPEEKEEDVLDRFQSLSQ